MDKFLNKIILGDSLEVLRQIPDNSVDAVITDPPYASGGKTTGEKSALPSIKYAKNKVVHRPDFVGDTKDSRSFIGIEKTEVYYNIALNRLKEI